MQNRLDKFYDKIEAVEIAIEEEGLRLYNIKQEKISGDNVYQFLLFFDKLYDRFSDIDKTFLKSFIEEEKEDGRILKSLKFRFSIFFDGQKISGFDWDNENAVESVVLLCQQKTDDRIGEILYIRFIR